MASNQFVSGSTTIQFSQPPTRDGGDTPELFQVTGYDSNGDQYVYDKGWLCRTRYTRTFPKVTGTLLAAIKSFFNTTVRGNYHSFTWYDHDAVAHTVRLSGQIDVVPTGPDRYSVSLVLEDDTVWYPPAMAGSIDGKTAGPLWILKLVINSVTYYLADGTVTVTPWGVTTKPWIGAWGSIRTGISGSLSEYQVSDFDVSLLSDPAATPNMETLATTYPLEKSPAELYIWSVGTSEAPRLIFRGYVDDVDIPDEITVNLVIKDETSRLSAYIGTKVGVGTYPNADPDDVGKILPIPFGSVAKLSALGLSVGSKTSLKSEAVINDTTITVSDSTGIAASSVLLIDSEEATVNSVSGQIITLGSGLTSDHRQGTAVIELVAHSYCAAGRAVSEINKVWLRHGDVDVDITAYCVRYIGQGGAVLSGYPNLAMLTISPANMKSIISTYQAELELTDHIELNDPSHTHTDTTTTQTQQTANNIGTDYGGSTNTIASAAPSYPTPPGGDIIQQTNTLVIHYYTSPAVACTVYVNGSLQQSGYTSGTFTWTGTTVGTPGVFVQRQSGMGVWVGYHSGTQRTVITGSTPIVENVTGITKTGTIDYVFTSAAVGSIFSNGKILCDIIADCSAPRDALGWILNQLDVSAPVLSNPLPASYAVNGAITEYKQAKEWLNVVAFQLRSWFVMERGLASLIVRPTTLTSTRTIAACRVTEDGVKVHSRKKVASDDILNVINLLYNRDWTQSSGDTAYQGSLSDSDDTSIDDYGEHEQPDLFKCDFITSDTMAADVLDYYLTAHAGRPWLHEFETYLDYSDVRFGQVVTLGFAGNAVGVVIEAGPSPGSADVIDIVKFTVLV